MGNDYLDTWTVWRGCWEATPLCGHIVHFGIGILGGALVTLAQSREIVLPRRTQTGVDCGALGILLLGGLSGLVANTSAAMALTAGIVGPVIIPVVVQRVLPGLVQIVADGLSRRIGGEYGQRDRNVHDDK